MIRRPSALTLLKYWDKLATKFSRHPTASWEPSRFEVAPISLVICDVNMPRMDGLQMLEVLKGQCPNLPVLMLTTESRLDKLERAKKAGAKA